MYQIVNSVVIKRLSDGIFIPNDILNIDYKEYLEWVAQGNSPTTE